jgi:hypothetical protein
MLTQSRVHKSGIEKSLRGLSNLLVDQGAPTYSDVFAEMTSIRDGLAALGFDTAAEGREPPPAAETLRLLAGMDAYAITLHQPMRDIAIGRSLAALAQLRDLRHARRTA